MVFSKLDIKDGYWQMVVKRGHHLNFVCVLPDVLPDANGARIRLVIPLVLQMEWSEFPPFFCAATETAQDIAEYFLATPAGSLPHHTLKDLMLPPSIWPNDTLVAICTKYLHVVEVYVNDF